MKKGDKIIIACVVLAVLISVVAIIFSSAAGTTVIVQQNNQTVYKGSLLKDDVVKLQSNTIIIKNGEVYMQSATCKNQICVKHKKISAKGETIICLPNRVTVEIK